MGEQTETGFAHDLLERLIAQPSIEGNLPAIERCLDLIHDALAPYADEIERPVHDGLPALLMRFGAGPAERMLTICGHIDVVSALGEWATPPFTLTYRDGNLIGRGGHAGLIHALDSPVGPAIRLAQAIETMPLTARDDRFMPPSPSVAITRIEAGDPAQESNVVPDSVTLAVDRRVLPREDMDDVVTEITRLIDANVPPPFRAEWRVIKRWPPCETSSEHLVSRAARAAVQATGRPGAFAMDLPANDTSWFVAAGIPAILLGPGNPLQAPATDESLEVEEFRDAIAVYAELMLAIGALPD